MKLSNFKFLLALFLLAQGPQALAESFRETKISDNVIMLQGESGTAGNIAVSIGPDGLLVVDNDYDKHATDLVAHLKKLGDTRFVLNTHWHFDHAGGNVAMADAVIVAHDNVRKRLSTRQEMKAFNRVIEPIDPVGLPDVTYQEDVSIYFNGDKITLIHLPTGHTDGDSAVLFARDNILHLGDHYMRGRFPFIDLSSGGNALQLAANIRSVINNIDDDTVVIPGHGELSNRAELVTYVTMLDSSVDQVKAMKEAGLSLTQMQEKGLELEGDEWGTGFINENQWISFIHESLPD